MQYEVYNRQNFIKLHCSVHFNNQKKAKVCLKNNLTNHYYRTQKYQIDSYCIFKAKLFYN